MRGYQFDCHVASKGGIECLEDDPHSPSTKLLAQLVTTKPRQLGGLDTRNNLVISADTMDFICVAEYLRGLAGTQHAHECVLFQIAIVKPLRALHTLN